MKNKATRGICLAMCLVMSLSFLVACGKKTDGDVTTTAEPFSDEWVQGLPGYVQIELTTDEVKALVKETLGDEAKNFNGDLTTLTAVQLNKVKYAAESAGYAVEKGLDGRITIKKTVPLSDVGGGSVALSKVELEKLVNEVLGDDAPDDFNGDLSTLTKEQLDKVEKAATDKGYVIDKSGSKPTINKPVETGQEKLTTIAEISDSDVKKAIRSALGYIKGSRFDGNTDELSAEEKAKLVNELQAIKMTNGQVEKYWKENFPEFADKAPVIPATPVTTTKRGDKTNATGKFTGGENNNTPKTSASPTGSNTQVVTLPSETISTQNSVTMATNTWVKTYGSNLFNSPALCDDGGVVVCGTASASDFKVEGKNYKVTYGVIIKYASDGSVDWSDTYGGDELTAFSAVTQLNNGDIIVVGYTIASNLGDSLYKSKGTGEGIMIKYSADGKQKDIKMVGGEGTDMIYSIAATIDGGFVIGGKSFSRTLDFASSTNTITSFVFKYDANMNFIWEKMMGGTKHSAVMGLAVDPAGNIFASYSTSDSTGDFAAIPGMKLGREATVVVKYSSGGGFIWLTPIYEVGMLEASAITYTPGGGCIVAGQYRSVVGGNQYSLKGEYNGGDVGTTDGCIFKIREIVYEDGTRKGEVYWAKTVVGFQNEYLTGIAKVSGGYVVSGYSNSSNRDLIPIGNSGDYDSFVYFVSEFGAYQTMTGFSGSSADQARGVCSNGSNVVYVCGATTSTDKFFASCSPKSANGVSYITKLDLKVS